MAESASQRGLNPSMNQADALSVADLIELAKADRHVSIPPNNWAYGTLNAMEMVSYRRDEKHYEK